MKNLHILSTSSTIKKAVCIHLEDMSLPPVGHANEHDKVSMQGPFLKEYF